MTTKGVKIGVLIKRRDKHGKKFQEVREIFVSPLLSARIKAQDWAGTGNYYPARKKSNLRPVYFQLSKQEQAALGLNAWENMQGAHDQERFENLVIEHGSLAWTGTDYATIEPEKAALSYPYPSASAS